jgi:hypothetical protein
VHPLYGSYNARAERIRVRATAAERDFLAVDVTFVEEGKTASFEDIATSADERANVDSAAADLATELETAGLESDVGPDAVAQADAWEASTTVDPRALNLELNEIANDISAAIEDLELATDVERYPVLVAMMDLHSAMRGLASYLMNTAPQLTTYTVPEMAPLAVICQHLYGGALALTRVEELLELNDLADPGLIPAGVVLTVITP